jgi:hypothetical protein
VDSEEFARWMAAYELDPWDPWKVQMILSRGFRYLLASKGIQLDAEALDPTLAPEDEDMGAKALAIFNASATTK